LLITIISFILEPVLSCTQKRWKYRGYENLEWITNETLQLQRLAYGESGQGSWSKCTDSIPVTAAGELLGSLDLSDLEHPRLGKPEDTYTVKETLSSPLMTQEAGIEPGVDQEATITRCDFSPSQLSLDRQPTLTEYDLPTGTISEIISHQSLEQSRFSGLPVNGEARHKGQFSNEGRVMVSPADSF
jgi:hypothetical protein